MTDEPGMPGVQVVLVDRVIGMHRYRFGINRNRSPEVGEQSVQIVDRLNPGFIGTGKQNGQTTGKWFDIVFRIPKTFPDQGCYFRFTAKVWKG